MPFTAKTSINGAALATKVAVIAKIKQAKIKTADKITDLLLKKALYFPVKFLFSAKLCFLANSFIKESILPAVTDNLSKEQQEMIASAATITLMLSSLAMYSYELSEWNKNRERNQAVVQHSNQAIAQIGLPIAEQILQRIDTIVSEYLPAPIEEPANLPLLEYKDGAT